MASRTPTTAELAILRALWANGPSTVREVHTALAPNRDVAYTTTLKMLQVMTAKGLTIRETRGQQHLYRAKQPEAQTQRHLVSDLIERAFGGSTAQLVLQALATKKASPDELQEIRRLLARHDETKETGHD